MILHNFFDYKTQTLNHPVILLESRAGSGYDTQRIIKGSVGKYYNLTYTCNANAPDEISFEVHKYVDNVKCPVWDELINESIIAVGGDRFEIAVSFLDETDEVKTVTGVSLETELGQIILRDLHINDDEAFTLVEGTDTASLDFDDDGNPTPVVLYNPNDTRHSLLHRVLEKAPHWRLSLDGNAEYVTMGENEVCESVSTFQRTFTVNGTSIYDFLTEDVANEANVLFQFNTMDRTITMKSLYDCYDEGGALVQSGVGIDTELFVSTESLANSVQINSNKDDVKNCFYVSSGDELIDSQIAVVNMTGSRYIYNFSDAQLADMPQDLRDALNAYQSKVESKRYEYYGKNGIYPTIVDLNNKIHYEESSKAPKVELVETNAQAVYTQLISDLKTMGVGVSKKSDYTSQLFSAVTNNVLALAKVLTDTRYSVECIDDTASYIKNTDGTYSWRGALKVTRITDAKDSYPKPRTIEEAKSKYVVDIKVVEDADDQKNLPYTTQKVYKVLQNADMSSENFKVDSLKTDGEFINYYKQFSSNRLKGFAEGYNSCMSTLMQLDDSLGLYDKYRHRFELVNQIYEDALKHVQTLKDQLQVALEKQKEFQEDLDFRTNLGDKLYEYFASYQRESEYTNSNYISDGIEDDQEKLLEKAKELLDVATKELKKACVVKRTITADINNLNLIPEMKNMFGLLLPLSYIRVRAGDEIFKMMVMSVQYDENSFSKLNVTFSDTFEKVGIDQTTKDMASILNSAQTIATSYNYTAKQASQGSKAQDTIADMRREGLDTTVNMIRSSNDNDVTITPSGLICQAMVDEGIKSQEALRITHSGIYLTDDNWKTLRMAVGRQRYSLNGKSYEEYGVNADFCLSSRIIGGEIYSLNYAADKTGALTRGTYIDLNNGNFSLADGKISYDSSKNKIVLDGTSIAWKSKISQNAVDGLDTTIGDINENINGLNNDIETLTSTVSKTVKTVDVEYRLSTSNKELKGNYTWSTLAPEWVQGTYMWSRQVVYYVDNSAPSYRNETCIAGASATKLDLMANRYVVAYNSNGTLKDASDIVLTATQENFPNEITWSTTPSVTLTGSGNTRKLAASAFNNNSQIVVKVTAGAISDIVTIVKVQDGSQGIPGTNGINGVPGKNGKDGKSQYIHIKYSPVQSPTDSQMTETPSEYIGMYVDEKEEDSNYARDYNWTKFIGEDGSQGIPGAPGKNGQTPYVHFAYAKSADGRDGFSTTPFDGALYIGTKTDYTKEDSKIYSEYDKWSKIKGDDGDDAYTIVLTNENHTFYASSDGSAYTTLAQCSIIAYKGTTQVAANITGITGTPTGMSITITSNNNLYTAFLVRTTNEMKTNNGVLNININVDGHSFVKQFTYSLVQDGVGISSVKEMYANHTSSTTPPDEKSTLWTYDLVYDDKKYLWIRNEITYTNGTVSYTAPYYDKSIDIAKTLRKEYDNFQNKVDKSLNMKVNDIGDDYIISPKIGGGYLYIESSNKTNWVEIDPLGLNKKNIFTIHAGDKNVMTVNSSGATIAGWNISDNALYKDVGKYRAYLQAPITSDSWIISAQEKHDDTYHGNFLLKANGGGTIAGFNFGYDDDGYNGFRNKFVELKANESASRVIFEIKGGGVVSPFKLDCYEGATGRWKSLKINDMDEVIINASDLLLNGHAFDQLASDCNNLYNGFGVNAISTNNNLNNMKTGITLGHNFTNAPDSDWYMIISAGADNTVAQVAFKLWDGTIYYRRCAGGTWSEWGKRL